MRIKKLNIIEENGKYLFVYNHNGHKIVNEVGTTAVVIDGKDFQVKKPFAHIDAFYKFCACTKLY